MAPTLSRLCLALIVVVAGCSFDDAGPPLTATTTSTSSDGETVAATTGTLAEARSPHIVGNQLVDADGNPIQLRGFNLAGTEYACIQGWGIFDGQADTEVLDAMADWGGNAIRVLLNEHCWLDRNGVDPEFSGETYQQAVMEWVDAARDRGFYVVFSLIWSDSGDNPAHDQAVMANRDHSLDFWESATAVIGDRDKLIFDLYGEPHDIGWDCWQSGCVTEEGYPAVGMQEMLDVVRDGGFGGPVIISGLEYANDLQGWVGYPVVDSIEPSQLVAGWHSYDFNACIDRECWDGVIGEVASHVPVIAVEFGGSTCDGQYVDPLMDWMDEAGLSYLAWAWNPWDTCEEGPDLVTDSLGSPTGYGQAVKDHYQERAGT